MGKNILCNYTKNAWKIYPYYSLTLKIKRSKKIEQYWIEYIMTKKCPLCLYDLTGGYNDVEAELLM